MSGRFRCEECGRDFSSMKALGQHSRDKHGAEKLQAIHQAKQERGESISERERRIEQARSRAARISIIKRSALITVPAIIIALAAGFIISQPQLPADNTGTANIPKGPIHWHPKLAIIINGVQQPIPLEMGTTGVHHPIHTHDDEGVLHYENNLPTAENMRLKYFFERVWGKRFSKECILDYCNGDDGAVKMYVNGVENSEFESYIPADGDSIRIEFG